MSCEMVSLQRYFQHVGTEISVYWGVSLCLKVTPPLIYTSRPFQRVRRLALLVLNTTGRRPSSGLFLMVEPLKIFLVGARVYLIRNVLPYFQPSHLQRFELASQWNWFAVGTPFGDTYPGMLPIAHFCAAFVVGPLGPWNVIQQFLHQQVVDMVGEITVGFVCLCWQLGNFFIC